MNSCQTRANGWQNRACFTENLHKKSALSYHIYKDHPEYVKDKLSNYSLGIIKSTSGTNLDRAEDYFVETLNADLSLNRYKVTSWFWIELFFLTDLPFLKDIYIFPTYFITYIIILPYSFSKCFLIIVLSFSRVLSIVYLFLQTF